MMMETFEKVLGGPKLFLYEMSFLSYFYREFIDYKKIFENYQVSEPKKNGKKLGLYQILKIFWLSLVCLSIFFKIFNG